MNNKLLFVGLFFICLSVLTIGYFVVKKDRVNNGNTQSTFIVCTTGMIADAVKQIGGEYVTVKGLMGPGIDPHLYRARESDVQALSDAHIIFYNGLHLEGKMGELFAAMKRNKKTVAVGDAIPKQLLIQSDFSGIVDPHIWHDVSLWMHIIPYILEQLNAIDPRNAEYFKTRASAYIAQLKQLDNYVQKQIESIPATQRILITAHDAFSYFGRRYGLTVIGLQGISTDAEISARDIQELADTIVKKKVATIFVESSIPQRNIQAVQEAVASRGWHVAIGKELFSDALGDMHTTAGTYSGMIMHNVNVIVEGLTAGVNKE